MALDYKTGPSVMLQLGEYQFGVETAAYQSLQHAAEWRWPSQDRYGLGPVLQYTGPGPETVTLPGVIYPEWRGGLEQLNDMREMAAKGEPQQLVDGNGNVLGYWAIEKIDETQTVFADAGVPRKQEFTVSLRRYLDEEGQ